MTATIHVAPLLQSFFTKRLMQEKQVSHHTISSYRDTFRLLLKLLTANLQKNSFAPLLGRAPARGGHSIPQ